MAIPRIGTPPAQLVLLGHPVRHSLSPRFQQAALDAAGLAVRYVARDVPPDHLTQTLAELAAVRAAGNVTIPHKEAVFAACDVRTALADRVGAVNTFWHDEDGRLVGHNTDVAGVRAAIGAVLGTVLGAVLGVSDAWPPRAASGLAPLRVTLLGAGGAAASVVVALADAPNVSLSLVARTPDRAEALATRFPGPVRVTADLAEAVRNADLVINATPIGLTDDAQPVDPALLPATASVLDLVYRPGETAWVRAARARGLPAEDGLRMLVEQGAAAFAQWFGREPDRDVMWRALEPRPGTQAG